MSLREKLLVILLAERTDKYFKKELEENYRFFAMILDEISLLTEEYDNLSWDMILDTIVSENKREIDFIFEELNEYFDMSF